jgi:hypothetical protein
VDPVPNARFASRQLFDQRWKPLKRADGSAHFRIRQRVNESLRASRSIPNLDVNCIIDEKQRTPDFHGRQRTPSTTKSVRRPTKLYRNWTGQEIDVKGIKLSVVQAENYF